MSSTTVAKFASELKKSTDTLLEQLRSAGVAKSATTDALSEADKQKLLGFLKASHGTSSPERKKITLVKKSTSEIKQADASGKARTIQVEVRKKRTFVKRDDGADTAVIDAPEPEVHDAPPSAPRMDDAELARREEEHRRQAELLRRQEEDLVEKRRLREEQERRDREAAERAASYAATEDHKKAQANANKEEAEAESKRFADERAAQQAEAREKAETESKARAAEEAARAADLGDRRRKAEA